MVLSIIIVNYNVKYFLEQCLLSVKKAIAASRERGVGRQESGVGSRESRVGSGEFSAEVFVVDNNSTDGSIDYLKSKFEFVQFIPNTTNVGFAKANNQALQIAKGECVLFLNPDTIVPEDCFVKCIEFIKSVDKAGACGVRMVDGSGRFLKESKRGFPAPWVSFCKLFGLAALFPHSKLFARYYLGHLNEKQNHTTDALPGAFMFVKKEVLDITGGFDEQFFMYAEDIDLSFRIQQAGYHNYYFADCTIIHFKGESTKRGKEYGKLFYKAMSQFAKKYYRSSAWYLEGAIWLRRMLAVGPQDSASYRRFVTKGKGAADLVNINKKCFLTGDLMTIANLKRKLLALHRRTIVEDEKLADEIVFCEGKEFAFRQVISQLQVTPGKSYKIHASESESVVGSDISNKQGEVIPLKIQ